MEGRSADAVAMERWDAVAAVMVSVAAVMVSVAKLAMVSVVVAMVSVVVAMFVLVLRPPRRPFQPPQGVWWTKGVGLDVEH